MQIHAGFTLDLIPVHGSSIQEREGIVTVNAPRLDWDYGPLISWCDRCGFTELRIFLTLMGEPVSLARCIPIERFAEMPEIYRPSESEIWSVFADGARKGEVWSLVEHYTHRGRLTTGSAGSTGISEPDWQGQDMSRFWKDPYDLRQYVEGIERHRILRAHEWTALRMDEGRQEIALVGDIYLVQFQGQTCRLVKTLDCQVIG